MPEAAEVLASPVGRWLEAVQSDPEHAGRPPTPADIILQLAEGNPQLEGIARYLAMREQATTETEDTAVEEETAETAAADESRAEVHEIFARLRAEVETLRHRNDLLAAALGACYLCWGEDATCAHCFGGGTPGSSRPNRRLFAALIVPAVRRAAIPRGTRPSTATTNTEIRTEQPDVGKGDRS